MEHLPDAPYRLFSCNLLFYISHDSFDRLLHQGDIQPVPNLHPPAGSGLDFRFQRVCEVLHLGFHHLLDVIQVGVMPEDWKIGKLKDVLKLKKTPIRAGENCALPYLPIDIIPIHSLALTEFRPNSEAQSSLITFDKDDILIGAMRVYFHRVTIAPCAGITRTTCFVLSPFDESYLLYALLLCNQYKSIEFAQTTSKGSTMPYAVWDGGLGDLEINIPQRNIVEKFNNILLPSIRQIQNSYFENTRLAAIRDALLPKLMSGEIDVSKVNISADKLSFTED